jgi:hypothetical protein
MKKSVETPKIAPAAGKSLSTFVKPGMFYNKV